jgi:cytoskeletal protein RodZ
MIKAEVITHEGNPGPNWLDHCRTSITPGRFIATLVIAVIAALALGLFQYRSSQSHQVIQTNTQSHPNQSGILQVRPLEQETSPNTEGLPTVQAPADSSPSTGTPATSPVQSQIRTNPIQSQVTTSARHNPATAPSAPLFSPARLLNTIFQQR